MKLKRILYWVFVSYLIINTIYTFFPLFMTVACIPTTVPFYSPVISSLITYHMVKMTYLHMALDLILFIIGIRSCVKQDGGKHFLNFTLIVLAVNFSSNLLWTFMGYIFLVQ